LCQSPELLKILHVEVEPIRSFPKSTSAQPTFDVIYRPNQRGLPEGGFAMLGFELGQSDRMGVRGQMYEDAGHTPIRFASFVNGERISEHERPVSGCHRFKNAITTMSNRIAD